MYYFTLIVGSFLLSINDKKKISFKIFVVVLAMLAFFRYGVGGDFFSYNSIYNNLNLNIFQEFSSSSVTQEIGFRLIGSFLKGIGLSYQQFLIVFAVINLYYISKICKKYSENSTLSLLLYYCFYYFVWVFSVLREGVTIAVGLYYLLECIENKKTIKIIVITLLLSLIHFSALILLPLYFISKINFKRTHLIMIIVLSIIIGTLPIGNIINQLNWIPIFSRLNFYVGTSLKLMDIFDFKSFGRLIFLIIALFYYPIYSKQSELSKKMVDLYIISLSLYFLLQFSELTAARLSIYGKVLDIIILTNIYYLCKDRFNKIIYVVALSLMCVLYFNKELDTMQSGVNFVSNTRESYFNMVPYTNIFNQEQFNFYNRHYFDFDD